MTPTTEQLQILRHMLGIDKPNQRSPQSHRDHYCACVGDPQLKEMSDLGLVQYIAGYFNYDWYRTTPEGQRLAFESHKAIRWPKKKRLYHKFLSISDLRPDLTFGKFLTQKQYAQIRKEA